MRLGLTLLALDLPFQNPYRLKKLRNCLEHIGLLSDRESGHHLPALKRLKQVVFWLGSNPKKETGYYSLFVAHFAPLFIIRWKAIALGYNNRVNTPLSFTLPNPGG